MLNHTVLYAKGWYYRSDNVWSDVLKCITADDYTPMSCEIEDVVAEQNFERAAALMSHAKDNIIIILTNNIANLIRNDKAYLLHEFIEATDKQHCWKHGYYHNEFWGIKDCPKAEQDKAEPYDYRTAVLYFFLSRMQGMSVTELWKDGKVPTPDINVLPIRREVEARMKIKKQPK